MRFSQGNTYPPSFPFLLPTSPPRLDKLAKAAVNCGCWQSGAAAEGDGPGGITQMLSACPRPSDSVVYLNVYELQTHSPTHTESALPVQNSSRVNNLHEAVTQPPKDRGLTSRGEQPPLAKREPHFYQKLILEVISSLPLPPKYKKGFGLLFCFLGMGADSEPQHGWFSTPSGS